MKRYWEILETIVAAGKPLTAAEIAQLIPIPRATCYRLVSELAELAIIDDAHDRQQYVLGRKFVTLALLGKSDTDVGRAVSSALQKLADQFGETAFIARIRAGAVELVHTELPQDASVSFIYPGLGNRPLHACSSAKAIAAFAEQGALNDLSGIKLEKFTDATLVTANQIQDCLEETRNRGFAICDQEIDDGIVSVAMPVFINQVGVIFSVGFVGPSRRMYEFIESDAEPVLRRISKQVAVALSHCSTIEASLNTNPTNQDVCQEQAAE